ncbi:MAG: B12-binding domain-containing radical SAM protein [Acidobacteria bacterium]|nr:B12-binding domain-containing radical SAM protein [Acidobacteriota bacterium]
MRVFFATTPYQKQRRSIDIQPMLGIFLLPQMLRECGCQVDVELNIEEGLEVESDALVGRALKSDVICLSALSFNWACIKRFVELIDRQGERPPIIVGGVHPTLVPDYIMRSSPADILVVGEGERTLLELIDYYRGRRTLAQIQGIYYRDDGQIRSTPPRELLTSDELAQLPCIDWNDYPVGSAVLPVQTSRGCLMSCTFCSIPFRGSWRPFPLKHVMNSIEACLKAMPGDGPRSILFADDCFTADRAFAISVLTNVTREFPQVRLTIEARVRDMMKPGFLETIARSSVEGMQVGIECGYDKGLRRIRKGLSVSEVKDFTRAASEMGMGAKVLHSFIVGFPWETTAEIRATIDLAFFLADRYGSSIQINWWIPMPGNAIFRDLCSSYGVDESIFDQENYSIRQDLFFRMRPWITKKEMNAVESYLMSQASSFPDVIKSGSVFSNSWGDTLLRIREYCTSMNCPLPDFLR